MKNIALVLLLLFSTVIFVPRVHAFTVRGGEDVVVGNDEKVTGTLLVAGNNVTVRGTVEGDLICGGRNVRITGAVHGDIICAAQDITVSADVDGSIRVASQNMSLDGIVGRNVTVAGQNVKVMQDVVGEVMAVAQDLILSGYVGGDAALAGETVSIASSIDGNANVQAQTLRLDEGTDIAGNLIYSTVNRLSDDAGKYVGGEMIYRMPEEAQRKPAERWEGMFRKAGWAKRIGSAVLAFLLTLALLHFAGKRIRRTTDYMLEKPWRSMVWGLAILFLAPFLILMMVLTLIGIPLAILAVMFFGIAIWLSRILAAVAIGSVMVGRYAPRYNKDIVVVAGIGTLITYLLFWIPVVNIIFSIVVVLWGMGGWKEFVRPVSKTNK